MPHPDQDAMLYALQQRIAGNPVGTEQLSVLTNPSPNIDPLVALTDSGPLTQSDYDEQHERTEQAKQLAMTMVLGMAGGRSLAPSELINNPGQAGGGVFGRATTTHVNPPAGKLANYVVGGHGLRMLTDGHDIAISPDGIHADVQAALEDAAHPLAKNDGYKYIIRNDPDGAFLTKNQTPVHVVRNNDLITDHSELPTALRGALQDAGRTYDTAPIQPPKPQNTVAQYLRDFWR